ncbi:glycosyltransferase family 2 protein [uncultured Cellulomonas sp.]|uniref:glycosyltransferase family 2 protein n=1 Tax=uncultured Cellulomonas sp. TaxID=189682 RepID=UPI0026129E35|nr:glycosyltransferase family 2 protein [uncultured Cellulomonas sp.]
MPLDHSRALVVLPAWNEEESLGGVLAEIAETLPGMGVLVVSDGSVDRTSAVARAAGVPVLELPINLGVGGAMRAGYKYAERHGYSVMIQLDADGQHDPRDVPSLLAEMDRERADVVIGARFAGIGSYSVRGPRRWAMKLLSGTLSRIAGTTLTDTTSGFKACGRRAISLYARNYPAEYLGDTVEALVTASRAGMVVRQVGVQMRPRSGGTPSQSPAQAALFLGRAVLALALALTRPRDVLTEEAHR